MIRIKIDEIEREADEATPQWINQQINRRRNDGQNVCVQVTIDQPSLNLVLATPSCVRGGGGGRPPNSQESSVFALWEKFRLNTTAVPLTAEKKGLIYPDLIQ